MKAKRSTKLLVLALLLLGGAFPKIGNAQPNINLSFQTFYHELSPYGRWTTSPQYGSVWSPNVSRDFQPYSTNGYWEMTEYGNTWISDYEWGWAAFHYGRWSFDDYLGWFWIPGYEWGPAWVNWRSGGGYYGWAPLGPGMSINVSVNIPSFWWIFVPNVHFYTPNWHSYWVPRNRVSRIYSQTTIINNYYRHDNRTYVYGPRRDEIERYTRRSVPVRDIVVNDRGRTVVNQSSRSNDRTDLYRGTPSNRSGATDSRYNGRSGSESSSPRSNSRSTYESPSNRSATEYNSPNRSGSSGNSRTNSEYSAPVPSNSRNYPSVEQSPSRSTSEPTPSRSTYEGRSSERTTSPQQNSSRTSPQPERRSYPAQERSSSPNVRTAPTAPSRSSRTESSPSPSRSSSGSERSNSSSERSSRTP